MLIVDTKDKLDKMFATGVSVNGNFPSFVSDTMIIGQYLGKNELLKLLEIRISYSTVIFYNCVFGSESEFLFEVYVKFEQCDIKFVKCEFKSNLWLYLEGSLSSNFSIVDSFIEGVLSVTDSVKEFTIINSIIYKIFYDVYLYNYRRLVIRSSIIESMHLHRGSSYVESFDKLLNNNLEIIDSDIGLFNTNTKVSCLSNKFYTYKSMFGKNIKSLELSGTIRESDLSNLDIRNASIDRSLFLHRCDVRGLNLSEVSVINQSINEPPLYFNECYNIKEMLLPKGSFLVPEDGDPYNSFFVPF